MPERIYAARRAAVLSRLTQERRLSAERAEALVAAWEAEGDERGLEGMTAAFWDDGTLWIVEQLGGKNEGPRSPFVSLSRRSSYSH